MTVKRRTIWMPDDEWAALSDYAKRNDRTVSQVLRESWRHDGTMPTVDRFNSRPFTPVPKRTKR